MGLLQVSSGRDVPNDVNVIIEIPMNALPVKYELDKESGALFVDRFLSTSMVYPCNYGYVPQTLSEDGDPVDVLLLSPMPVTVGCVVRARMIGMMRMTDESGVDAKLLAVPVSKLCKDYDDIQDHTDVPASLLAKIDHFFTHYKDLEDGKWAKIDGWDTKDAAHQEIMDSINRYHAE
ncbi:MAG: inorganic diphosphatase [Gammaproteobacteria bacterium]|nr:inorganic diphosphatase [Gammaproteobacteria bacterium]